MLPRTPDNEPINISVHFITPEIMSLLSSTKKLAIFSFFEMFCTGKGPLNLQ